MERTKRFLAVLMMALGLGALAACAGTEDRRATGQVIDDAGITARVKTAFIKSNDINANAINVNTYRGEVVLSGFVESEEMIRRAGETARRIDGVRVVRNDLRVVPRR